MGNHKFRLSDMMPNAWFYKLKYMGANNNPNRTRTSNNYSSSSVPAAAQFSNRHQHKTRKKLQQQQQQQQGTITATEPRQICSRKSYYFTRERDNPTTPTQSKSSNSADSLFPDPPPKHRSSTSPKMSSDYNNNVCPSSHVSLVQEMRSDRALPTESFEEKLSWSSSSYNDGPRNIVIDIDDTKQLAAKIENSEDFVTIFDLELRPILTKPKLPYNNRSNKVKLREAESRRQSVSRRFQQGTKLRRVNSPRVISSKRLPANGRRSLSSTSSSTSSSKKSALTESTLAIVKTSMNPQEDFKQSMVEMIVEHGIRSSKDLEELLACYLSLNSDVYHDLIISVFKQIWIQLSGLNNTYTNPVK